MRGYPDVAPEIAELARARAELLGAARFYASLLLSDHGAAVTARTAEHALCEAGQDYARAAAAVMDLHAPKKKGRAR